MAKLFYFLMAMLVINGAAAQKKSVKKVVTVKAKPVQVPAKTPVVIAGKTKVKITTDSGVIVIRLYDRTPKHRDNFIKLVKEKFYDSLLFHRIIAEFMIQGGDPDSKNAPDGVMLGGGDIGYTIPAEIDTVLFHKKGVLAAARTENPAKASSGCQFYIVQGKTFTDQELDIAEARMGRKFSAARRLVYKTIGGSPWLDGNYTVYGEVVSGLNVIDKIASVPKDVNDRPLANLRMKMELVK